MDYKQTKLNPFKNDKCCNDTLGSISSFEESTIYTMSLAKELKRQFPEQMRSLSEGTSQKKRKSDTLSSGTSSELAKMGPFQDDSMIFSFETSQKALSRETGRKTAASRAKKSPKPKAKRNPVQKTNTGNLDQGPMPNLM